MTQKDYSKLHYQRRKENGLCPRCGKKLDREGHYCTECLKKDREYKQENRRFFRDNGLCHYCGKEMLYGQEKQCIKCREKRYEKRKPLTEEQKIRYGNNLKEQQRRLYKERSEQGICTRCGKRKAEPNRKKCGICLDKDAKQARKKRLCRQDEKERRRENNLCYRCGDPIDIDKGQLCSKCYSESCKNLEKARLVKPENKFWKEQNKLISYNMKNIRG